MKGVQQGVVLMLLVDVIVENVKREFFFVPKCRPGVGKYHAKFL